MKRNGKVFVFLTFIIFSGCGNPDVVRFLEAERLWKSGDKAGAADKWHKVLHDEPLLFVGKEDIFEKVVKYYVEEGNTSKAQDFLKTRNKQGI